MNTKHRGNGEYNFILNADKKTMSLVCAFFMLYDKLFQKQYTHLLLIMSDKMNYCSILKICTDCNVSESTYYRMVNMVRRVVLIINDIPDVSE